MFGRILVPLDGSEEAERICGWMIGLAGSLGSEAGLMAVVDPESFTLPGRSLPRGVVGVDRPGGANPVSPGRTRIIDGPAGMGAGREPQEPPPGFGTQIVDQAVEVARRHLHRCALNLEASGVRATVEVAEGSPAEEIVKRARSPETGMIAMITCREPTPVRGSLGSVTHRVLRLTPVPLLTMHPHDWGRPFGEEGTPSVIVVPLDGSELSEAAVPVALHLAKATEAELLFLWVLPPSYPCVIERFLDYLFPFVQQARSQGLRARAEMAAGSPVSGILETVMSRPRSLVVMSTHGTSGFRRWSVGSVTEQVIRSSGRPVLVIPPGAPVVDPRSAQERAAPQKVSLISTY